MAFSTASIPQQCTTRYVPSLVTQGSYEAAIRCSLDQYGSASGRMMTHLRLLPGQYRCAGEPPVSEISHLLKRELKDL